MPTSMATRMASRIATNRFVPYTAKATANITPAKVEQVPMERSISPHIRANASPIAREPINAVYLRMT